MSILSVENVTKSFGSFHALKGVSLTVERGEAVAIIGSSGSGKSTLLRCVNDLEHITSGSIAIDGEYLVKTENGITSYQPEKERRRICMKTGMVFQQFNLFPHMSALENITVAPIRILNQSKADALENAKRLLGVVGLETKADSYPAQLSGGQQQRIAIARALAINPDIMLFDEPTSALDPELTAEVTNVIAKLAQEDITMMIVTHEMEFARRCADRILFFDEGEVVAEGTAAEFFENQQNERIKRFLASIEK